MRLLLATIVVCFAGCGSQAPPATVQQEDPAAAPFTMISFNVEAAPTVKFSVPDMHCQFSCAPKVMETLVARPGVKDVKVELESKTAIVAIDQERFDADEAIAALVDAQFTNTTVVDEETAAEATLAIDGNSKG